LNVFWRIAGPSFTEWDNVVEAEIRSAFALATLSAIALEYFFFNPRRNCAARPVGGSKSRQLGQLRKIFKESRYLFGDIGFPHSLMRPVVLCFEQRISFVVNEKVRVCVDEKMLLGEMNVSH
jgi:hypothetical protein